MPYTIDSDAALGVVCLAFTGQVTAADLKAATSACISLQKQTAARRFLVDLDGWTVAASANTIADLPDKQYREEELDVSTRIAVILPKSASAQEAAHFFELTCRNRGWNARVCPSRGEAIAWLRAA